MAFFLGLVSFYLLFWVASLIFPGTLSDHTMRGVLATTCMFVFVGISHFAKKEKIEAMIPPGWPFRSAMNYISGAAEIILGIGLLFMETRLFAAIGLLLLLVAVFPANIYVARKTPTIYNISRMFFQPMYMVWIWWFCIR